MKKTNLKKIIILSIVTSGIALLPIVNTSALSASLSCSPKTVNPGNESLCIMSADSTGSSELMNISAVQAEAVTSGSITLKNVGFFQGWEKLPFAKEGKEKFTIAYADEDGNVHKEGANIGIASFTVVASQSVGTGTISVNNIIYTSKEFTSNSTPLKSNTETISIVAPVVIKEEEKDTGTKDTGNKDTGTQNTGNVAVKPATNPTTPPVIKDSKKSSNTYLSSLSLSDGVIGFDKDVTEYSFSVPFNVTDIEVVAVVDDNKSTITVTGNTNLAVGENKVTVMVTSENGATRTYTLTAIRQAEGEAKEPIIIKDEPVKPNIASIFGMVLLSLITLGAAIFFIFFILKRRKDKEEKQPFEPPKESAFKEKDSIENSYIPPEKSASYDDSTTSSTTSVADKPEVNDSSTEKLESDLQDLQTKETEPDQQNQIENEELDEDIPPQDSYYH